MATHRRKVPSDPQIRKNIRDAMEFHGITKSQLATMMNLTRSAISQWLSGSVTPSDEHFERLAVVMGEDEDFLRGKTVGGKKGFGAVLEKLREKAGVDGIKYLAGLQESEIQRMISGHKGEKAKKKRPRKPAPRK